MNGFVIKNKKIKKSYLITGFLIIIILGILFFSQINKNEQSQKRSTVLSETSVTNQGDKIDVNRSFQFIAPPESGTGRKSNQNITFTITQVEQKNSIKVKDESKPAPAGKDYLLIRLEIDNPTTQRIRFLSADFVRLLREGNKKFAPDYHNGIVTLDPISVKRDLLAFTINENETKYVFQVGELDRDKEQIEIEFK